MRKLKDIKVGDIVVCDNTPDHDYETYILIIDSVEYDKEFITEENPQGILAFGRGYTEDEHEMIENAGYTFRCSEENFVGFLLDDCKEKIYIELNNDMTHVIAHSKDGILYSYTVMGTGEDKSNEIVGYVSIIEEQELFEWLTGIKETTN